ncbi:MAG: PQQ-dependent sugar dehydrogenase [Coriobacteriia bacterium]|nr:PQQ-dependent sugar dehydrogenase [Coriobacteriia bacterium]
MLVLTLAAAGGCSSGTPATKVTPVQPQTSTVAPTNPAQPAVDLDHLSLTLEPLWRGLDQPVYLTNAGDGSGRLFVAEQTGAIKEIANGTVQLAAYLDLSGLVSTGGERGLLGMAFSPHFATDGRLYVNYTDTQGNTVIARYTADSPSSLTPRWSEPQVILKVVQPYANHNGGCLQFGPDGMLYIGMGDGGSAGDPQRRAQDLGSLLGKMLRIDVSASSGSVAYSLPADNPFVATSGARGEIWSLGLRNPWRFSFDSSTGALWIGDVGQNAWEEIDYAPKGASGQNWGWNLWEGNHPYPAGASPSEAGFSFPVLDYPHPTGESVIGGYVYRGGDYPAMVGTYLYADYINGWIGGVRLTAPDGTALATPEVATLLQTSTHPASFGVDERGELYLVDHDGTIWAVNGASKVVAERSVYSADRSASTSSAVVSHEVTQRTSDLLWAASSSHT